MLLPLFLLSLFFWGGAHLVLHSEIAPSLRGHMGHWRIEPRSMLGYHMQGRRLTACATTPALFISFIRILKAAVQKMKLHELMEVPVQNSF